MDVFHKLTDHDTPNLIELCLRSNFSSFMGDIYKQSYRVEMVSPLSPIIANLFMEYFETKAFEYSPLKPKFVEMVCR